MEKTAFRGTLGLSVAMGIGRFFYTPVLPLMILALTWSGGQSAAVATSNYIGYLIGAVAMSRGWMRPSNLLLRISLVASTVLLALVPLSTSLPWLVVIRLIAGIVSAIIFVCVTQPAERILRQPRSIGVMYGGVGLGIVLSGLLVTTLGKALSWSNLWFAAAVLSAVLSAVAWFWPIDDAKPATAHHDASGRTVSALQGALFKAGYFFEGFGYIIIGTYLVVLAGPKFGPSAAALTWIAAGLAALPSTIVWSHFAATYSRRRALILCYSLQFVGALAALFGSSTVGLFVAALLFGGTFMGITMLSVSTGTNNHIPNASATLTTWYSLGQVVGPALVGQFLGRNIQGSFVLAAVAIALAAGLSISARLA